MASSRSASYSQMEDQHLCHVYLDITQNPTVGINQPKDKFWSRVEAEYHATEPFRTHPIPGRSLQTRMGIILKAISKFRGCVNQIENKNPNGASEQDIMDQAKLLLAQDPNYKKGFVFGHVWNILKDIEKFSDANPTPRSNRKDNNFSHSESSSCTSDVPSLDLNEDVCGNVTERHERPIGVKRAKAKVQNEKNINDILEANKQMYEALRIGNETALKKLDAQNEKNRVANETNRLANMTEENKILFTDLNNISDPEFREYIKNERKRIMRKRANEYQQHEQGQGSQGQGSQYQGSQYRASQYQPPQYQGSIEDQGEEVQGQDQRSQNFNPYFKYLGGTRNDFNNI